MFECANWGKGTWKRPHLESVVDALAWITFISFDCVNELSGLWSNEGVSYTEKSSFFLYLFWPDANLPLGFCVYVCVSLCEGVHECVDKLHSTHPCVLPRQIPSGVSRKWCSRTYKWTDKQPHTIIHTHITLWVCLCVCFCVSVHQCVGGR